MESAWAIHLKVLLAYISIYLVFYVSIYLSGSSSSWETVQIYFSSSYLLSCLLWNWKTTLRKGQLPVPDLSLCAFFFSQTLAPIHLQCLVSFLMLLSRSFNNIFTRLSHCCQWEDWFGFLVPTLLEVEISPRIFIFRLPFTRLLLIPPGLKKGWTDIRSKR